MVLCVDEKSQIQALDRTQPGLPLKPGRVGTMTHDYKRHGTTTLFAALSTLDGTLLGDCMPQHRHQEFIRFLKRIDQHTPSELDLHLIVDNYATHKHPRVERWLRRHPRFHLHFTPTSCSWLNLVERWFRNLTEQRLRRGSFHNVKELIQAIGDYISGHNQNPRIFFWSASVERILTKVAKCKEYQRLKDERFTRLHLDHVPVVDEDNLSVDYEGIIREAIELGYQSVMVDGSRLSLEENTRATRKVAEVAHAAGVAVEGELGAVFGHEAGPPPPYEELFASGKGFTAPGDAKRLVEETHVDWLSVAIGNVHGAISDALRNAKKVEARLDLKHLDCIYSNVNIPLVLHGGSGIKKEYIREAVRRGIAKINVATSIRQPFEVGMKESPAAARQAAFDATVQVLREELGLQGTRRVINPEA